MQRRPREAVAREHAEHTAHGHQKRCHLDYVRGRSRGSPRPGRAGCGGRQAAACAERSKARANASTTAGSNCVPAQARNSSRADSAGIADL